MRPITIVTVALLLAAGPLAAEPAVSPVSSTTPNPNLAQAKALTQEFASTLRSELEAGIKAGGPIEAIGICKDRAPEIAAQISAKSGWDVRRVSLKWRNAKIGRPDAWEQQVLSKFDERKAAGEPVETMAFAEVVEQNGARKFRFMKAIPTGELCLACHGKQITPQVATALDQAYPRDRARGYSVGDVRGAFSLTKSIQ
ncbi:DUF3365 domain-containing protein [uncultured Thiodictyon sp.]|uniref:Tll0287-like domain-containing protein n=1 Tax=uncultured Thiodictyon sp. TaxID=1846217 RepID=UPI0025F84FDA|nr:DUF3365 domain-containing protein [uncultured Thiodictyon sp.]